jgi:hypothetical protein
MVEMVAEEEEVKERVGGPGLLLRPRSGSVGWRGRGGGLESNGVPGLEV